MEHPEENLSILKRWLWLVCTSLIQSLKYEIKEYAFGNFYQPFKRRRKIMKNVLVIKAIQVPWSLMLQMKFFLFVLQAYGML